MKRLLTTTFIAFIALLSAISAIAQEQITLTTTRKAGETLKLYIFGTGPTTVEGATLASGVTYTITATDGIITIKGTLSELNCSENEIVAIDLSKSTHLNNLDCSSNNLVALDVSTNKQLKRLFIHRNKLSAGAMDKLIASLPDRKGQEPQGFFGVVDGNSANENNVCSKAHVAAAHARGWDSKIWNGNSFNAFEGRDLEIGKGIITMRTSLPKGQMVRFSLKASKDFSVEGAIWEAPEKYKITSDDGTITLRGDITNFTCESNKLTMLDVSQNSTLKTLHCNGNDLTELNLTNNTELEELKCFSNNLTALNISQNSKLKRLYCSYNRLTQLDVTKNELLEEFHCYNNQLSELNVTMNKKLRELGCLSNKISSLDLSQNGELLELYCSENQLTELNVSKNTQLLRLSCSQNALTLLDLSQNIALHALYCTDNKFTQIDLKANINLRELNCSQNSIKGEAMDALIASLPDLHEKSEEEGDVFFGVINHQAGGEGNVCTKKQVAAARARGWIAQEYKGSEWVNYEGSEEVAIDEVLANEEATIMAIYSIEGHRLNELQEGVNIIRLSNGQTRKIFVGR